MIRISQVRHPDGWMLDEWLVIRDGRVEAAIREERDAITLEGAHSPEALAFIAQLQAANRAARDAAPAPRVPAVEPNPLPGYRIMPCKRRRAA